MQTFLPYSDFDRSARCLDMRRLGNQRVEAFQIHQTLLRGGKWERHPAVLMWRGYEDALLQYMSACIREWIRRGYNNNMAYSSIRQTEQPFWLGNYAFHKSHRSNLLRKKPEWYRQFGWKISSNLPYFWPVRTSHE